MEFLDDKPTLYQIHIKGALDERWSKRFGGMQITPVDLGEKGMVTILSGEIADQAALYGVLLALYDMHLPLIAVKSDF